MTKTQAALGAAYNGLAMGIFSISLPPVTAFLALLAVSVMLFRAARSAPWNALMAPGAFSAWCIFIITLPLLWRFDVPAARDLTLHLLGFPLFVLMFGRQLAMTGIAISVLAYTAIHDGLWGNLGINLLLLAAAPAYCGDLVMRATRRFLPHHLFVYLLGNGFFGALAMLAATGLISIAAHALLLSGARIQADTIAFMLLLSWGEAFLTGFLLSLFTVYYPEWVLTFDDEVYLRNK